MRSLFELSFAAGRLRAADLFDCLVTRFSRVAVCGLGRFLRGQLVVMHATARAMHSRRNSSPKNLLNKFVVDRKHPCKIFHIPPQVTYFNVSRQRRIWGKRTRAGGVLRRVSVCVFEIRFLTRFGPRRARACTSRWAAEINVPTSSDDVPKGPYEIDSTPVAIAAANRARTISSTITLRALLFLFTCNVILSARLEAGTYKICFCLLPSIRPELMCIM